MSLVHDFNFVHGVPEELSLIVDCVGIVLVCGDLPWYDNRHVWIALK